MLEDGKSVAKDNMATNKQGLQSCLWVHFHHEEVWAMLLQRDEHGTRGGTGPPAEQKVQGQKEAGTDCICTDMGSDRVRTEKLKSRKNPSVNRDDSQMRWK